MTDETEVYEIMIAHRIQWADRQRVEIFVNCINHMLAITFFKFDLIGNLNNS